MKAAAALFIALAAVPLLAGEVGGTLTPIVRRAQYLMGTVCEITVASSNAAQIESAFAEAKRIESMLSTWTEDSALSRLNRGETGEPPAELTALLGQTLEWSRRTNGAFDPRIRALVEIWKTRGKGALPDNAAIAAALTRHEWEEGGFGKGYALDRMLATLQASEAMINFGGQVAVRGAFGVTIADPARRDTSVVALTLRNGSLSTSSASEKSFEVRGRRFSHIIDPRTGQALPPRGSVSVIAAQALTADILSTALYVMGEDDGLRWADANGVAAIFITPTHDVRLSAAARDRSLDVRVVDRNYTVKD